MYQWASTYVSRLICHHSLPQLKYLRMKELNEVSTIFLEQISINSRSYKSLFTETIS